MPKRDAERRRRNARLGPELIELPAGEAPKRPAPSADWHHVIREWWDGIVSAPQAELYTSAEWGWIKYLAHRESVNLLQDRPSAQASALFLAAQGDLLVTEGARRRLRVDLTKHAESDPVHDAILAKYRLVSGGGA
jgi:hypothetical protein